MKRTFFTLFLLACNSLYAGGQPVSEHLQLLLEPIQSLKGNFSQRQYDQSGEELSEFNQQGQMQLGKSGQIRWIVSGEYGQQLISNGETLWLYDPDLEQVTIRAVDTENNNSPALLLMGDFQRLANNYQIERGDSPDNFLLSPHQSEGHYQNISITFKDELPSAINILDNLGERTAISFTELQLNPTLDNSEFEFQPPPGVDLIRN